MRNTCNVKQAGSSFNYTEARLSWLLKANALEAERQRLFRDPREEEGMLLMRHPIRTQKAYALFGMLLGSLPLAAFLFKLMMTESSLLADMQPYFPLLLAVNAACCPVGGWISFQLAKTVDEMERKNWFYMLFASLVMGLIWGYASGSISGVIFFGFGAYLAPFVTIPTGLIAFMLFTALHRPLARGGMIDARHFWPLACGVTLLLAALILGW